MRAEVAAFPTLASNNVDPRHLFRYDGGILQFSATIIFIIGICLANLLWESEVKVPFITNCCIIVGEIG